MAKEGWNWLWNARKEHYFRNGRSLCGRWLCLGSDLLPDEPVNSKLCRTCQRKRQKELEKEKNGSC